MAVIDMHVHIAANDRPDCKASERLQGLAAFTYMLVANGIKRSDLNADFDGTIREHLLGVIQGAEDIDRVVLLALDWIYDTNGNRLEAESDLVVSNDYVMELARTHPEIVFGASVNPNRGEAAGRAELERVIEGPPPAALLKWVPNSQRIDPADARHDWFYRMLAEHDLPLLSHCGPEYAIPVEDEPQDNQLLGDVRRLRRALDHGVTVIVPHAGTRFFPTDPDEYDSLDDLRSMLDESVANGWRLYADLSAMCVLCRVGTIERARDLLVDAHGDRLILGSDYPVPINDIPPVLARDIDIWEYLQILNTPNPLDKNLKQLKALDFPASIGAKAQEILPQRALDWVAPT